MIKNIEILMIIVCIIVVTYAIITINKIFRSSKVPNNIDTYRDLLLYLHSGNRKIYDTAGKRTIEIQKTIEEYSDYGILKVKIIDQNNNSILFRPNRFIIVQNKAAA